MSMRWVENNPRTFVAVLGLLIGVFTVVPPCFAGGAVTIVPAKDQLAPRGSYIPERRVEQILNKVEEYKATMKEKESIQHGKQPQENESPKPKSSEEKQGQP